MAEKVLVLGASLKENRYSNMAVKLLLQYGHQVIAVGNKKGEIENTPIVTETHGIVEIDTVTLYLNPQNQEPYKTFLIKLKPKRIIFNPGTENPAFEEELSSKGIRAEEACTLVLLRTNQF